jgi:hypothetical protein
MDRSMIRVICVMLGILLLGLIVVRRKKKAEWLSLLSRAPGFDTNTCPKATWRVQTLL